ncbi:MAG: B12-binding domain-containing radical SAM protein, partial [Bacteroidetes bacterium HGW-Bacteroidetes-21]
MKIKLISPRMTQRPTDSYFKRVMSPPLSLVMLATLSPKEHQVSIVDENTGRVSFTDNPDLVGITVNVDTSQRAFEIAAIYRARNIPVVCGGIHASANANLMLEHFDAVVIGEAEKVWGDLLTDVSNDDLQPVYQSNIADLSIVPLPDWSYIKQSKYLYSNIVVASRGCPYKCHFCYNSSEYVSNPFRNRPIQQVVDEIRRHKTRQIMFIDDNFIGNIAWTRAFTEAIKDMGL